MKCLNCKYEFDQNSSICPACGSSNVMFDNNNYIENGTCPNCHANLNGTNICPKCGTNIDNPNEGVIISQETQEKIAKIGQTVGITLLLINIVPFVGLVLLVALGFGLIFLLGKGIITEIQLASIVKTIFLVVPVIFCLLYSKYKSADKKPIFRKVILSIAVIFVLINIVYYVQPVIKFSNFGSQKLLTQENYSIPTIAKITEGKTITSIKIKETEKTVYLITYEGNLSDSYLNEYIALLEKEKFYKETIDNDRFIVYAKKDENKSLLIKINPNMSQTYEKCSNYGCVEKKIRDSYEIQYWFVDGDYHNISST